MFGAAIMVVLGIAARRFAVPVVVILFFLVFFGIIYIVQKHRLSYWYLIFPLLIVAGYLITLSSGRESALVRTLYGDGKIDCVIVGKVHKVQVSQNGYKITLYSAINCIDSEKTENCIVYTNEPYERGTVIEVAGRAALFDIAYNPGEFDARQYYRSMKIGFRVYADTVAVREKNGNPIYTLADRLSGRLYDSLYSITDSATASVFAAMLLGRRDELDPELSELFAACGIGHVLAISGLHVSLIGMGLYKILRKCGAGYLGAMIVGTAVILFYGVMTGNGTSTVRALIMYITAVYANVIGRTYDMLSAASLAAIIMLADNPLLLYNGGFQLSFGAVMGIVLIAGSIKDTFKIEKKLPSAFVTSLSIQAATMPVIMWNYYEVPVLSVLLNMLVVPLMTVVMISAVCGSIAGMFSQAAGAFCIGPGVLVIRLYKMICTANVGIPWAVWVCGRPSLWQVAAYYALLAVIVFTLKKYCAKGIVWGFVPAFAIIILRFNFCFEADFLYVGQGDGIFIRSDNGVTFLVDGGSSDKNGLYDYTLEPFLMSKGVSRLDYAIVTHCDADHISGLASLLENGKIKVDTLYMPQINTEDEAYGELWELAGSVGTKVETIYCGYRITAGSTVLTCLHPGADYECGDRNGSSTVLVVENDGFLMLLTGDIGEEQESLLCDAVSEYGHFDILKAAHHGSKNSNSADFITAAAPEYTVISCGKNNRYGHPHEETLERLRVEGSRIMRTDECGDIIVTVKGGEVKIEGYVS